MILAWVDLTFYDKYFFKIIFFLTSFFTNNNNNNNNNNVNPQNNTGPHI
jgi:hypothetical protein